MSNLTPEEIEDQFSHHPTDDPQVLQAYDRIRRKAKDFARYLNEVLPESTEGLTALRRLDDVVFFANASIARHGLLDGDLAPREEFDSSELAWSVERHQDPPREVLTVTHKPTGLRGQSERSLFTLRHLKDPDPLKDYQLVKDALEELANEFEWKALNDKENQE